MDDSIEHVTDIRAGSIGLQDNRSASAPDTLKSLALLYSPTLPYLMRSYRIFMQGHRFVVEVIHPSGATSIAGVFDGRGAAEQWVADQLIEADKRKLRRSGEG
jgi:hypothetical protein